MDTQSQVGQLLHTARTKHAEGALVEAVSLYEKAARFLPRNADLAHLIGAINLQAGSLEPAEKWLKKAISLNPRFAEAYANIGATYRLTGRIAKAIEACRTAIQINPTMANAHFNLGRACFDAKDFGAASNAFRDVLNLAPNDSEAILNLGASMMQEPMSSEARVYEILDLFDRVLTLQPQSIDAHANIGQVYTSLGWMNAALAMYERALSLDPGAVRVRYLQAGILLIQGQLDRGWDDYEYRTETTGISRPMRRKTPPPYWSGESLSGKTIFVWPEQGLGDQIIYSNMIADIVAQAGRVYVESKPRLTKVYERSFPRAIVLGRRTEKEHVPAPKDCDYQIGLGSAGRYLRRGFSEFPRHSGYLLPDPVKTARRREKYQAMARGRRIVGVSWRSRRESIGVHKSSTLVDWRDVLTCRNVWFVNLQYGDCSDDLAEVKQKLGIDIFHDTEIDPMGDLDDFFSQVAALDLVVSTSNTTVHVAGSMNIPTWILLPRTGAGLWYWFLDRPDSPWYPAIRFYRQSEDDLEIGCWWSDALARLAVDFRRWADHG